MSYRRVLITVFMLMYHFLKGDVLELDFYSEKVKISFDENIRVNHAFQANSDNLKEYYNKLRKGNYGVLLTELMALKNQLGLNDYYYYKLLNLTSCAILKNGDSNEKVAFCCFLLNISGFDCVVRFNGIKNWSLYVWSKSDIVNTYFLVDKKKYIALEDCRGDRNSNRNVSLGYMSKLKGRPFVFTLVSLPKFSNPDIQDRQISFRANGGWDTLTVALNISNIRLLNETPQFLSQEYFKISPSQECSIPMVAFFKERTKHFNDSATVRYLLSFVRTGFKYVDDAISFGKEKPMVAEEVLYYPTADCEDKSALFFFLIKELLHIDMLVLEYPNHLNVAVLLDKPYGKPFEYNGKQYSVCEPNVLGDGGGTGYSTVFEKYPFPKVTYVFQAKEK